MSKDLQIVKSANFGSVQADIYSNGTDIFMTTRQLYECLGENKKTFSARINRNPYLKEPEFSGVHKMQTPDGKTQDTRVFNEDGIYEITMLSESDKGKEFRAWFRKLAKALRTGKAKVVSMTDYQQMMSDTRQRNVRIQEARILSQMARKYQGTTYEQVLDAHATKALTGDFLLPLPKLETKTYSAGDIAEMLGTTAHRVGMLTNQHNLKVDAYGEWFKDKAKHSNKEVPAFRYYENIIPVLKGILQNH